MHAGAAVDSSAQASSLHNFLAVIHYRFSFSHDGLPIIRLQSINCLLRARPPAPPRRRRRPRGRPGGAAPGTAV